jgi:protein involved in polysaccharide export with SLBB domain
MRNVVCNRFSAAKAGSNRRSLRWVPMMALVTTLVACAGPVYGQSDSGGLSQQNSAPVSITPAPNNPAGNTPVAPIFPPSAMSQGGGAVITRGASSTTPNGPSSGSGLGYGPIRPGDIVEVEIFDATEYAVRMPVSPQGLIAIPYAGLLRVEGMTSIEAAHAIAELFEQKEILRDPPGSMKNPTTVLWDPTLRENDNAELEIKTGETILVSKCGVVYVGGNVGKPGAYPLCESNHTTLTQVMALAQGAKPSSSTQKTLLFRSSTNGTRVMQTVKLDSMLRGRQVDITMQPDDIIFVPASIWKAAGKTALISAIGFATQAYLYAR